MRFSLGCLSGTFIGIVVAAVCFFGYLYLNTREDLALFPAAPTGAADITITLRESYINQQMQADLGARGMNIANPSFNLHAPNRAAASGDLAVPILGASITVHPTVNMHFGVSNGQVTFDVDRVDVSGLAVPQDLVNQQAENFKQVLQAQLNAELKGWLVGTGLRVVGVEATEGNLIIKLGR